MPPNNVVYFCLFLNFKHMQPLCVLLFLIHLVYSNFAKTYPCAVSQSSFNFIIRYNDFESAFHGVCISQLLLPGNFVPRCLLHEPVPLCWMCLLGVKWLGHWGCLSSASLALLDTARYHSKVTVLVYTHSIRVSFSP